MKAWPTRLWRRPSRPPNDGPRGKALYSRLTNPGQAKRAGRKVTLRLEWETIKLSVMETLLRQKFAQDPWRGWLSATGDEELIEGNTWGDTFWGVAKGSVKTTWASF